MQDRLQTHLGKFKMDDRVRVINPKSAYFGKIGIVIGMGQLITHSDDRKTYEVGEKGWNVAFGHFHGRRIRKRSH